MSLVAMVRTCVYPVVENIFYLSIKYMLNVCKRLVLRCAMNVGKTCNVLCNTPLLLKWTRLSFPLAYLLIAQSFVSRSYKCNPLGGFS